MLHRDVRRLHYWVVITGDNGLRHKQITDNNVINDHWSHDQLYLLLFGNYSTNLLPHLSQW